MTGKPENEPPRSGGFPFAAGGGPQRVAPRSEDRIPVALDASRGAADDPRVGTYIGPYRVESKLSKGGMGLVYLAMDEGLRRRVALKVMDGGLLSDEDALKRFEREARAAAAVSHRHIAQIYLVGLADDGMPFLAMEYISGGTLLNVIRNRAPITFSQAALWMEQVVSALEAAKRLNIIHRDIKPANIMITAEQEAKVVDFGLAKIFFEDSYMTQEGMVLGTPSYMAPEQGQGRVVDHRADIYSLGATFYHLLTGRPPFMADSPVQIMMKHVTAPLVPMRSINQNVPIEFDEVIGRCMRKDQDERYQDYETLLADVKRLRLQCTSREGGSFVGASGEFEHASAAAAPPGGSGSFPPPPRTGGASAEGPPKSTTATIRQGTAPVGGGGVEASGWTVGRVAMVMGGAVLLVVGVLSFIFRTGGSDDSAAGAQERRSPLGIVIQRNAERAADAPDPDLIAYRKTVKIIESLRGGLAKLALTGQNLPSALADIANEEHVIVNFEKDDTGHPLDGWGTPIGYTRGQGRVFSAGLDRTPHTSDDIWANTDLDDVQVPSIYENIENSSRK